MRKSINDVVGSTVQSMINAGLKKPFTEKELDSLGVVVPKITSTTIASFLWHIFNRCYQAFEDVYEDRFEKRFLSFF